MKDLYNNKDKHRAAKTFIYMSLTTFMMLLLFLKVNVSSMVVGLTALLGLILIVADDY